MPDPADELPDANRLIQEEEEKIANKAKSTVLIDLNFSIEQDMMRKKVLAMSKMMKMLKSLREENETAVLLSDSKVPKDLLLNSRKALETDQVDRSLVFN